MRPAPGGSQKSLRNGELLEHRSRHARATPAVEGKGVHQDRADPTLHGPSHHAPGSMQARLHSLWPDAEGVGRLFDTHLLEHAQDQDGSEALWELVDRLLDEDLNLTLGHAALRIHSSVDRKGYDGAGAGPDLSFIKDNRSVPLPSEAEGLVDDDADQPSSKA